MNLAEISITPPLYGQFTAYEGDIEWITDERTGLLVRANPVVFRSQWYRNTITTIGKQMIEDLVFGAATVKVNQVGVGTDSTASAAAQTKLNPSVAGSVLFQACDATFPSRSGTVETFQSTFGTGVANFSWNEAGVANGTANDGTQLYNRLAPIGPFNKTTAVAIVLVLTNTQS